MSKVYGTMANRTNKSRASMGAPKLLGEIIKAMDIASVRKIINGYDDYSIDSFKRKQYRAIIDVCPAFGAAYHTPRDKHSMDKGSD